MLFLHGIPTSCALWNGVIGILSGQFQCIAVDLPGLGRSANTPHGFRDLDALAASIEDIRIEHRIEKWHIVGHDGGCACITLIGFDTVWDVWPCCRRPCSRN